MVKFLVAIDGSENSKNAFYHVKTLANKERGDIIYLLRVTQPVP